VVRLTRIWKRVGTGRQDMAAAGAGDIVSLTGAGGAAIADTVAGLQRAEPLAPGPIEPPTLRRAAVRAPGRGAPAVAQANVRAQRACVFTLRSVLGNPL
jgi:predicted membrane GTPase involved in stress response